MVAETLANDLCTAAYEGKANEDPTKLPKSQFCIVTYFTFWSKWMGKYPIKSSKGTNRAERESASAHSLWQRVSVFVLFVLSSSQINPPYNEDAVVTDASRRSTKYFIDRQRTTW